MPEYEYQAHVDRVVAAAPPLNPEQRDRLAAIFAASRAVHPEPAPKANPKHQLIERLAEGLDDV